MRGVDRRGTRESDARERSVAPSRVRAFLAMNWNAPAVGRGSGAPFGKFGSIVRTTSQEMIFSLCGAANYGRRRGSIRENIIGHGTGRGMAAQWEQFLARIVFRSTRSALLLPDQPASEHGTSVFFDPLIEQSANLLAEIGGMRETRKFVALE